MLLLIPLSVWLAAESGANIVPEEKPVAVMVHGAGGGGWEWDFWKEVFEKSGWDVVAPDLVPAKDGLAKTSLDDYVKQVIDWCPQGRRFALIGASMGGMLALKAAEKTNPFAIVLINSVPPKGVTSWKREGDVPDVIQWSKSPLQETRDALWDSDEKTILWAHERWRDESGRVIRELREATAEKPKCPVLVIASRKDDDIPPSVSLELAKYLDADYIEYANMSHVGPLLGKRARDVAKQTLEWLRLLSGAQTP